MMLTLGNLKNLKVVMVVVVSVDLAEVPKAVLKMALHI